MPLRLFRRKRAKATLGSAASRRSAKCTLCEAEIGPELSLLGLELTSAVDMLKLHRENECPRSHVCMFCSSAFVSEVSQLGIVTRSAQQKLEQHMQHECCESNKCPCGETFTSTFSQLGMVLSSAQDQLAHHREHECPRTHRCSICGLAFVSKFNQLGLVVYSAQEQLEAHRVRELLGEQAPEQGHVYRMYHGTSRLAAKRIEAEGFRPSTSGMLGPGIYASRDIRKAQAYGPVVFELEVNVGKVLEIKGHGHPLQTTWQTKGYDCAWVPPNCGMVASGLEEDCIRSAAMLQIVRRVQG